MTAMTLDLYLDAWSAVTSSREEVAVAIKAMAGAAQQLAGEAARGELSVGAASVVGENAGGDTQKKLDVEAHDLFVQALEGAPVAEVWSEEAERPVALKAGAPLLVAIDPLDGSGNIDANMPIGTIFSILPASADDACLADQLAAGFFIYGPATSLALTVRQGTVIFTLDRASQTFVMTHGNLRIPERWPEYAINASNYRHWDAPVQAFVDDCVIGEHGPCEQNFNMRWNASLVAEAYRILLRGGIFLYPRDARPGYEHGRLRLAYEAAPIALLIEQAGGAATDAIEPILGLWPAAIHQRTPLVFGSRRLVERVARYHRDLRPDAAREPLFGRRSLFRV